MATYMKCAMAPRCYARLVAKRLCNTNSGPSDAVEHSSFNRINFQTMLTNCREEARKSLFVKFLNLKQENSFLQFCLKHSRVDQFFTLGNSRYAIVKFSEQSAADSLLARVQKHHKNRAPTRFIYWNNNSSGGGKVADSAPATPIATNLTSPSASLKQALQRAESVGQQMEALCEGQRLCREGRLARFLAAQSLQESLGSIIPGCTVDLFGSTVNGFGNAHCDLDMCLGNSITAGLIPVITDSGKIQVIFNILAADNKRAQTRDVLRFCGNFLKKSDPLCGHVRPILNARVPIIKFFHRASNVSCDLSSGNRVASKTSELLYAFSALDGRVAPLVFSLRQWAKDWAVTCQDPGQWITNFSLTLMTLFFLQTRSPPVIPTFGALKRLADATDKCSVDGTDCTVLSDLNRVPPSQNTQSVDELLAEFFQFYINFDFDSKALSILEGQGVDKSAMEDWKRNRSLYIQNPFELHLNVSKNVTENELDNFVDCCIQTSKILNRNWTSSKRSNGHHAWGLLSILNFSNRKESAN